MKQSSARRVLGRVTKRNCLYSHSRRYHDESFGFRAPRKFTMPDYSPEQLHNRAVNAPLQRYVDGMRMHGHRAAKVDPLNLLQREEVAALSPARYGLTDPEKEYVIDGIVWHDHEPASSQWPLKRIVSHMRAVYVGAIAYEYMHSPEKSERLWFSHLLESEGDKERVGRYGEESKRRMWELLAKSEVLDTFLQDKFPNLKRYGLEGAESMIPALDSLFQVAAASGVEHIVIGMPHRGRLNLLTDLLQYAPRALFHKIRGNSELPMGLGAAGDVISHLPATANIQYANHDIKVTLLHNPSHLEAINPVAMGTTRAKQYSMLHGSPPNCMIGDKVMCVQLHGDAAFTGQGIVMESLGLSNLPHYTSGGSVHLVVNNNIGYTTPGTIARSSLYCSDIGKMINAPVLHVNGDYPQDVARAMETAFKYRHLFRKDIIVDLITYRRWGHNELDEPSFTQPLMYEDIRNRHSVPRQYEGQLIEAGIIDSDTVTSLRQARYSHLQYELEAADLYRPGDPWSYQVAATPAQLHDKPAVAVKGWSDLVWPTDARAVVNPDTGVERDILVEVGKQSVSLPGGFYVHDRLKRHIGARLKSLESGTGINWGTAEALAFGSLMRERHDVRISGQDVGRGTFSHRHAMFVDQKTEEVFVPLNDTPNAGRLELANSSLSELAVLGFEYGMTWENPNLLGVWEAQFGDFFNGAQVIIDTFVSSGQTKWLKQSGIVMLLPHGLDGAGPEHSSMRIERMLQLTNDPFEPSSKNYVNMTIANPTTAAQYFHLLRRQMKRNFRKPLIIASPKGLLRSAAASSTIESFLPGTKFEPVLADMTAQPCPSVDRVVFVSGKLYYDLVKARAERGLTSCVAIVRVEELCPFPFEAIGAVVRSYGTTNPNLSIAWVQEEARNQGAWPHVSPRLDAVMQDAGMSSTRTSYIGRRESEVPAVGVAKLYQAEVADLIERAFNLSPRNQK